MTKQYYYKDLSKSLILLDYMSLILCNEGHCVDLSRCLALAFCEQTKKKRRRTQLIKNNAMRIHGSLMDTVNSGVEQCSTIISKIELKSGGLASTITRFTKQLG